MFSASKSKGASSGYQIANSLRFRSSTSAYLNRTPSVAGNQKTWTMSFWMKRGKLSGGSQTYILGNLDASALNGFGFSMSGTDNISFFDYSSTYVWQLDTTAVYRDPSAWYHVVLAVDTTQATSNNRVKLYVNGAQVTAFSTANYPSQNSNTYWNNTSLSAFGRPGSYNGGYFDGYLADVHFIDGQALTPSSFGAFNATTGVWGPIAYTGTYGTNGFHLNFSNGTSTTTLGYDSSGNGNNWTTNNISLTAGSTYDWMIDSPTPYQGSSYGVGNYAVLNPILGDSLDLPKDGNLKVGGTNDNYSVGTIAFPSTGKFYAEATVTAYSSGQCQIGICPANAKSNLGGDATAYIQDGSTTKNGSASTTLTSYTQGDVIGIAVDVDNSTVQFYKNNVAQTALTGVLRITSASYFVYLSVSSSTVNYNFGQRPFAYTPPSGYKSLCTNNLPTPTIQNGAGYMAATLYTGTLLSNAVSNAVNGVSFQPDFVWIKSRSAATDHKLTDSVRGTTKALISDSTTAETTDSQGLTTFGSSGFTVGTDIVYNNLAATYVGWQWKAGGTAVTNTAGSITSSVSANTTSGFSVVTYTGTGANATVGHGLGVAPSMVIFKVRSTTNSWLVYHVSVGATAYLLLDSTTASTTSALAFNNTAPTSSVFTISTGNAVNQSTQTYVAYCFAAIPGYSAFGSYTGNGSADGPFMYCGFRPRYLMIKRAVGGVGDWIIRDTARDPYNTSNHMLLANSSNAEDYPTSYTLDILSNGFKITHYSFAMNGSGDTYIYAAFAENPFQNALAR